MTTPTSSIAACIPNRSAGPSLPQLLQSVSGKGEIDASACLRQIVAAGLDRIPLPGHGQTRQRWSVLAEVAAFDLSLAKLFEAHTDALAICAELDARPYDTPGFGQIWGVWCAESPATRLLIETEPADGAKVIVNGTRQWCSGAATATHALVSAHDQDGGRWLLAIDMADPGIAYEEKGQGYQWNAVGMAATDTRTLRLEGVQATCVGPAGAYLQRPGFWHGGIGIAACWYGAAAAIGLSLRDKLAVGGDALHLAQLGQVDVALAGARACLLQSALAIDENPRSDASLLALRARLTIEVACVSVMQQTGEALGAAPFCRDRHFARLMADLPVFLRQSHAQRDRAALGAMIVAADSKAGGNASDRDLRSTGSTGSDAAGWAL